MEQREETTPDQLLDTFRGRGLKTVIIFTIVVHVVVLLATSAPYLMRTFGAGDRMKLSETERMDLAVKEAMTSLKAIAESHGVKPQDLGSRLGGGAPQAPREEAAPAATPAKTEGAPAPSEPEKPKSEIEKQIEKTKEGPAAPAVEEEVDLFK